MNLLAAFLLDQIFELFHIDIFGRQDEDIEESARLFYIRIFC